MAVLSREDILLMRIRYHDSRLAPKIKRNVRGQLDADKFQSSEVGVNFVERREMRWISHDPRLRGHDLNIAFIQDDSKNPDVIAEQEIVPSQTSKIF
jgi:hypothetical protein